MTQKSVSWTKKTPYKEVVTRKQYMNPYDYFEPEKAKKILSTHCIRSDMYWINNESKRKRTNCAVHCARITASILKRITTALFYGLLIIMGAFTGGFFWPLSLRKKVLSLGVYNKESYERDSSKDDEDKVDYLLSKIDDLEVKLTDMMEMNKEKKETSERKLDKPKVLKNNHNRAHTTGNFDFELINLSIASIEELD